MPSTSGKKRSNGVPEATAFCPSEGWSHGDAAAGGGAGLHADRQNASGTRQKAKVRVTGLLLLGRVGVEPVPAREEHEQRRGGAEQVHGERIGIEAAGELAGGGAYVVAL